MVSMLAIGFLGLAWASSPDEVAADALAKAEWRRLGVESLVESSALAEGDLRPELARALGQLKTAEALPALLALRDEPDRATELAIAEALGYTPDSAEILRAWLDATGTDGIWLSRPRSNDLRPVLLRSLGRQGDASDIPRLIAAVSEPWPMGAVAADALAKFSRRGIAGTDQAVHALIANLQRMDPRIVSASAHALRRVGLAQATPGELETVQKSVFRAPGSAPRAWLARAVWGHLGRASRARLFAEGMADPNVLVRIAILDAVTQGDVDAAQLEPFLNDPQPTVRSAATAALGRTGGSGAALILRHRADDPNPWVAAEAVRALLVAKEPVDLSWMLDPSRPTQVRAAVASQLRDAGPIFQGLADPEPMVRSSAAEALLEADLHLSEPEVMSLLASDDAVVRISAIEWLKRRESRPGVVPWSVARPLLLALQGENDPEALVSGMALLQTRVLRRTKDVDLNNPGWKALVERAAVHPDRSVRTGATSLASDLKLVLPRRDVVDAIDLPVLKQARQIRSARVTTNKGEFRMELHPEVAPLAVVNFAALAEANFYDGVVFHRVVPSFVVQTGDPRGDGSGGPGWTLPDELSARSYVEGAVGMARSGPDTGGSQWFITLSPQPHLDGDYTLFGNITDGMTVVHRLELGDRVEDIVIERVDTP